MLSLASSVKRSGSFLFINGYAEIISCGMDSGFFIQNVVSLHLISLKCPSGSCSALLQGSGGKTEAAGCAGAAAATEHPAATQAACTGCNWALPKSASTSFSEIQTMSVMYLTWCSSAHEINHYNLDALNFVWMLSCMLFQLLEEMPQISKMHSVKFKASSVHTAGSPRSCPATPALTGKMFG